MAKTKAALSSALLAMVVERDNAIEADVEKAKRQGEASAMALAEWRWIWTSDTAAAGAEREKHGGTADKRLTQEEFADATGKEQPLISRYAGAWADWLNRDENYNRGYNFTHYLNKRRFGEYGWAAAIAVGKLNPSPRTPNKPRSPHGVLRDSKLKADADKVRDLIVKARAGGGNIYPVEETALRFAEQVKAEREAAEAEAEADKAEREREKKEAAEEARKEAAEALAAFEAGLADAVDDALTEIGFSDAVVPRREEAAIVKDLVRDELSDFIDRQGSAAAFDTAAVALACAQKRDGERKRAMNKEKPAPLVGWGLLLTEIVTTGNSVVKLAEKVGQDWKLSEDDLKAMDKARASFGEAVESLDMAFESKRTGVVAGAEALLKGGV